MIKLVHSPVIHIEVLRDYTVSFLLLSCFNSITIFVSFNLRASVIKWNESFFFNILLFKKREAGKLHVDTTTFCSKHRTLEHKKAIDICRKFDDLPIIRELYIQRPIRIFFWCFNRKNPHFLGFCFKLFKL